MKSIYNNFNDIKIDILHNINNCPLIIKVNGIQIINDTKMFLFNNSIEYTVVKNDDNIAVFNIIRKNLTENTINDKIILSD